MDRRLFHVVAVLLPPVCAIVDTGAAVEARCFQVKADEAPAPQAADVYGGPVGNVAVRAKTGRVFANPDGTVSPLRIHHRSVAVMAGQLSAPMGQ